MTDIYQYDKKNEQNLIKADSVKRKKEQYIENLREGDAVGDFFAVKSKRPLRPYKRGTFFELIAGDKTGDISIKYWGGDNKDRVKRLYDSFDIGDVIQIRTGAVEIFEEKMQISVNEQTGGLRKCAPTEYDASDFLATLTEEEINNLYKIVETEIKNLTNKSLQTLLAEFFNDATFVKQFKASPSAMTHHHNYIGGNLEHTVGVIQLTKTICTQYPDINQDLVICGAILHDVGKLKEYEYTAAIGKTDEGNFIGHIVMGDRWIQEKIGILRNKGTAFAEPLELQLRHMILSHHGRYEYGSPRMPQTTEAVVLHQADLMDSQVKNYLQNVKDARKNSDSDWAFIYDPDVGMRRPMYLGKD